MLFRRRLGRHEGVCSIFQIAASIIEERISISNDLNFASIRTTVSIPFQLDSRSTLFLLRQISCNSNFPDRTTGETKPRGSNSMDSRPFCPRIVPLKIGFLKNVGMEIPYLTQIPLNCQFSAAIPDMWRNFGLSNVRQNRKDIINPLCQLKFTMFYNVY